MISTMCKRNITPGPAWWFLAWCTALLAVFAGPDGSPLVSCKVFHTDLNAHERHALRDIVQILQSAESHLGQLRLGSVRAATTPNAAVLSQLKATELEQLNDLLNAARIPGQAGISGPNALAATAALAATCMSSHLNPAGFGGRPVFSFLLNYWKRPQVVPRIAANLRTACAAAAVACELVVNVDNPHEASAWAAEAGFVVPVFSNNLHEARGYNRAARLARGRYLVIWQDDQIPPTDGKWITNMVRLFESYPALGVLGMNAYRICRQKEGGNRWGPAGWAPDPRTGLTWSFVHFADFAPLAVPAAVFWELGGLEEGFTRPGDCGITGDWELCARAWVSGYQVGHIPLDGREADPMGEGSTHSPIASVTCWHTQMDVGGSSFTRRFIHPKFVAEMCERVWALNMLTFTPANPDTCPYGAATRGWANCTAPSAEEATRMQSEMRLRLPLPDIQTGPGQTAGGAGGGGGQPARRTRLQLLQ